MTTPSVTPLLSHLESVYNTSMEPRTGSSPAANRQQQSPSMNRRKELEPQHRSHLQTGEASGSRSYENGVVAQSLTPSSDVGTELPVTLDEDFPEPICGGCKKLIDEDSADAGVIHFATQLWHVDCFRCAKCGNLVTTDCDDILLLSDGNPICGQCNYSCQICGLPIMEEAIMTGDESYHAACFTCRSCHSPISELVFAKTSQGIYCMKCHNQRVARSRRHADRKKSGSSKVSLQCTIWSDALLKAYRQSKQIDGKPSISPSGDKSPRASTSMEDSLMVASGSEGTSTRTQTTSPTPSMSSLNPYHKQGGSSSGSLTKPQQSAPSSLRDMRNSVSDQTWASPAPDASHATPLAKASSFTQGEASPRINHSAHLRGISEQNAPNSRDSWVREEIPAAGLGIRSGGQERRRSSQAAAPAPVAKDSLATPSILQPSSASEAEGDAQAETDANGDAAMKKVQYKRASRLSVKNGPTPQDTNRISKSFSFYDPDIVNLMDSMTRFGSSDELSLDMPASRDQLLEKEALQSGERSAKLKEGALPDSPEHDQHGEAQSPTKMKRSESAQSLKRISIKMKESIKQARDGHVSMDTKVVEAILQDLDSTRERIKTLQAKYDRIRRASQQAAQGFSSAREEYEQEVQARYDAEAEMLGLKKQLHLQAGKLAELTQEKKQQETLQRRSHLVKHSIEGLERDLAKLTVERDLTVEEVAELVALKDSRNLPNSGNEENVKRALNLRLEGVKDRYRSELNEVKAERDEILLEIEELRQTREAMVEGLHRLQSQTDALNASVALLTRRAEHAQVSASGHAYGQQGQQVQSKPNTPNSAGFGFNFGRQNRPSGGPLSVDSGSTLTKTVSPPEPVEKVLRLAPVPIAKVEAVPRKFKWKKGAKLTAETARTASLQLAAGLQGVINPSPPVPPKAPSQQSSPYGHSAGYSGHLSMQQQQQQHLHGTSSQHTSTDQSLSPNGHHNGGEVVVKEHLFQTFNVLRPTRCFACQKNMWGQSEMKCTLCSQVCHIRCLQSLPTSCNQPFTRSDEAVVEYTGPTMFGRALSDQVQAEGSGRKAPLVVEKCIQAVEHMGMDYEGIYRKSGGTSQLKIITQLFENRQPFNLEDTDRFNDISAVTSVLKNYFRELPEPLLTFELYQRFIECTDSKVDVAKKEAEMRELVRALPKEHFDTLKMLIDHLHRVQDMAEYNRMNSRNLGVVFGPTLMRSVDPALEFAHMGGKAMTIEFMIDNPHIFD